MSNVKQYRKKPVVIEAILYDGKNADEIYEWMGGVRFVDGNHGKDYLYIQTLEGTMRADHGDYIIKGVQSEFYPCKPNIFEATYEPVAPTNTTEEETHD